MDFDFPGVDFQGATAAPSRDDEELQKIYDVVPRTEDVFNLNKRDLEFRGKLGRSSVESGSCH